MDYGQLVKVGNQDEFDWCYLDQQQFHGHRMFEQQYSNSFMEFNPSHLSHQRSYIPDFQFKDLDDISGDLSWWEWDEKFSLFFDDSTVIDSKTIKTINTIGAVSIESSGNTSTTATATNTSAAAAAAAVRLMDEREFERDDDHIHHDQEAMMYKRQSGRYKSKTLELDEIQKYFDVPITKAAKELRVGLTVLKKRCRELNIMRWPHRKIKSLNSLIHNVKELGLTSKIEIEMLEEHKRMLEKVPQLGFTERTKKLRQACFKANYKKKRFLTAPIQSFHLQFS